MGPIRGLHSTTRQEVQALKLVVNVLPILWKDGNSHFMTFDPQQSQLLQ